MKIFRYKVFYLFRKYSIDRKDKQTAETVIALIAIASFMYCTPLLAILLKALGLLEVKAVCWMIFGAFAFYNFQFISKKYTNEIHHAVEYVMMNDVKVKDKFLIGFLTLFSFPYLIITLTLLRSSNFL